MKNMYFKKIYITSFIGITLLLLVVGSLTSQSNGNGIIVSIIDSEVLPDHQVSVPILIEDVSFIDTAEINLTFDNSVVNILGVVEGDFDVTISNINNDSGWLHIGGFQIISSPLSGDIKLVDVTLKATGTGGESSFLNFTKIELIHSDSILDATSDNATFSILDNTPPSIINVEDFPDPQNIGGYVNITCDIIEYGDVDQVNIVITYPDTTILNFSMNQGSYFYNSTYSQIGTYNYYIWANDTLGNSNTSDTYTFTIQEETYVLSVSVVGDGMVLRNPDEMSYIYGAVVTLTAVAESGWVFSHWSGDVTGGVNPGVVTMTGNKSVVAHFSEVQYSLSVGVVGEGGVTKDPDQGLYTYGAVVTLTAVAESGWVFSHWSGDLTGTNPIKIITIINNLEIIANFVSLTTISIKPTTQNIPPGSTFILNVTIAPTQQIAGVQFNLHYNPQYLSVNTVLEGNIFNGYTTYYNPGIIDNINGTITGVYGAITIAGGGISKKGTFALINFSTKTEGATTPINLSQVLVGDLLGNHIPITLQNATVTITEDNTPPLSHVIPISSHEIHLNNLPIPLIVNATDKESGIKEVSLYYQYSPDNSTWTTWIRYMNNITTPPYTWMFTAPWGPGYYHFYSVAVDKANNQEHSPSTNQAQCKVYPNWDINTDDKVNILDLILAGQAWHQTGPPFWIPEDVNCDGIVNILDLILIGQHWTG